MRTSRKAHNSMMFDLSKYAALPMPSSSLNILLKSQEADRAPGYVEETLESAGCTGGCESLKDGLPNCEACSQFKVEKR